MRLRLNCGHVVERTSHSTHKTLHNAFTGSVSCPECGPDPVTVVDGKAIGLVAESPAVREAGGSAPAPAKTRKPTKADLAIKVAELEAEVARLQGG